MVRPVAGDLPEQVKNNQSVNTAAGNGGQKMSQYSWFTVYLESAAKGEEFFERIGVILSQAQNGLKFIDPIAGAGFDISPDVCKKLSMCFVLELAGDLVLTFDKAKGTLAEVVGSRDQEIIDPCCIVLFVFSESDLQGILELCEITTAVLEIFLVA